MKSFLIFLVFAHIPIMAHAGLRLKHIPCFKASMTAIESMGGVKDWLSISNKAVTGATEQGHVISVFPTEGRTFISVSKAKKEIQLELRPPSCKLDVKIEKNITENAFTDYDLAKLLKSSKAGIVYLWSPHMELSIDEMSTISKQVFSKDITFLVDHKADGRLLEKMRKRGIAEDKLRAQQSHYLDSFDIAVHYPSLVLYRDGVILKRIPGMNGIKQIEQMLGELKQ